MLATETFSGAQRTFALMALACFIVGVAKAMQTRDTNVRWYHVMGAALISTVAGCCVGEIALAYWGMQEIHWVIAVSTIGSYMGRNLFELFGGVLVFLLRQQLPESQDPPPKGKR